MQDKFFLALRFQNQTLLLRRADGVITPGCEKIVESLIAGQPCNLDELPHEIAEVAECLVVSANSFRYGGEATVEVDIGQDRP